MFSANDRVCVYGGTGRYGSFHLKKMIEYGTKVNCVVSKNRLVREIEKVGVYQSLSQFPDHIDTAIFFVPAQYVLEAFNDAVENGVKKIVVITEHVPIHDSIRMVSIAKSKGVILIGPNCPGVIHPKERFKVGIMPEKYFAPGSVAIISRSGTLMYETAKHLSEGPGVSIALGLGGDPIVGTNVAEAFEVLKSMGYDKVLLIGEIGGEDEIRGVEHALKIGFEPKNIVAFFAGRHAPEGKRMGHAGAIIEGDRGKISFKENYLKNLGVRVVKFPWEVLNAWKN
ncbi:succinate--CoA ligase subunit alpha [Fervidobacterium islandicum]|uniref:succinate--CoA ligase subunit alpha n=1 Tax=Fervidobacterium islandicum TaxID=2423 RepID=UPI003A750777